MKSIYMVLSHSNTRISKMIKYVTKDKYSHISISLDKSCENMFSFGRKYIYFPIIGCFNVENIHSGLYKVHEEATMAIYELKVTNEQYNNIYRKIQNISLTSEGYNILGLLCAYWKIKLNRKKYYCSEFIYDVLSDDSVNVISRDKKIFKPMEILDLEDLNLIYEGKVINYSNT